jgi:hypothetical protein
MRSTFFAKPDTTAPLMASTESVSHDDLIVCACGDREFKARDAIDAAFFRGDLPSTWKAFVHRAESQRHAEERDMDLDEEAFDAAAEAFRYQHDLITAEETEQWLASHALSLDEFGDYFARQCWANAVTEEFEPAEIDYLSAPPELHDLFACEVILSGELGQMTTQLSRRLAARKAEKDTDPNAVVTEKKNFFERNKMQPKELSDWLKRLGRDAEWFEEMVAMEAAYGARAAALLIPEAYQRELATLRLPLTRFEIEVLELEARDAAQEALFCVREDEMSMEEVAKEGRYPYRRDEFVLEDVPEEIQQKLLSVSAGQVLEPIQRGDGFELCRVIKKAEPRVDDPAVHARVEQRLLDRYFSELTSKYVEHRLGLAAASG